MLAGYAYTGMTITGSLHCLLGVGALINACVGLSMFPGVHCGLGLLVAMWFTLVGCIGISAGMKRFSDEKTRQLKTAYMTTAICSACLFCLLGAWAYTFSATFIGPFAWEIFVLGIFFPIELRTVAYIGEVFVCLEFILAIVSSSICCCCSGNENTTVIVQTPFQQVIASVPMTTTVPYQILNDGSVEMSQPPPYTPISNPA